MLVNPLPGPVNSRQPVNPRQPVSTPVSPSTPINPCEPPLNPVNPSTAINPPPPPSTPGPDNPAFKGRAQTDYRGRAIAYNRIFLIRSATGWCRREAARTEVLPPKWSHGRPAFFRHGNTRHRNFVICLQGAAFCSGIDEDTHAHKSPNTYGLHGQDFGVCAFSIQTRAPPPSTPSRARSTTT